MKADDEAVAGLIRQAGRIAVLTGAGISTTAGIPDFRGPRGLYVTRQYDPEKTFDITYFDRDPSYFFAFARDFVQLVERVQPTFTHRFLAAMEEGGKLDAVITQNIDGLHQKAGSKRVIEVHGSVRHGHCRKCGRAYAYEELKAKVLRRRDRPLRCLRWHRQAGYRLFRRGGAGYGRGLGRRRAGRPLLRDRVVADRPSGSIASRVRRGPGRATRRAASVSAV